jgi:hypothetical protein
MVRLRKNILSFFLPENNFQFVVPINKIRSIELSFSNKDHKFKAEVLIADMIYNKK